MKIYHTTVVKKMLERHHLDFSCANTFNIKVQIGIS